jgi:hypothetical protein
VLVVKRHPAPPVSRPPRCDCPRWQLTARRSPVADAPPQPPPQHCRSCQCLPNGLEGSGPKEQPSISCRAFITIICHACAQALSSSVTCRKSNVYKDVVQPPMRWRFVARRVAVPARATGNLAEMSTSAVMRCRILYWLGSRWLSALPRGASAETARAIRQLRDQAGAQGCSFSRAPHVPHAHEVQTQCSHGCTWVERLYMQAGMSHCQL